MKRELVRYVVAIFIAALLTVAWVVRTGRAPDAIEVAPVLSLASLVLCAGWLSYKSPTKSAAGSVAHLPLLAVAIVSPTWMAIVAGAATTLITQVLTRRGLAKTVFNVAQVALGLALAVIVYDRLGGLPFAQMGGGAVDSFKRFALPIFALAIVHMVVNTMAVSGVIALAESENVFEVWKESTLGTAGYSAFVSPIAFALAAVAVQYGFIGVAAVTVPLMGIRQLYKTTHQVRAVNQELLELMVKAIEARDPYTSGHSRRVARNAVVIAKALGMSNRNAERVRIAALLHDVGKIDEAFAPILRKPGRLTDEEWAIMQTHPAKGAELVATMSHLSDVVAPIRHHHEQWNGGGYPDRISGSQIPLAARIITFADTLDALTTDRPYRPALTSDDVRAEFVRCRGTQFDPEICDRILEPHVWDQLFDVSHADRSGVLKRLRVVGA